MKGASVEEIINSGLGSLSRLKRRLRAKLNVLPYMPQAILLFNETYSGVARNISDESRALKILNYLQYEGCISAASMVSPKTATITQLGLVHDFSYLSQLNEAEIGERIFGQGLTDEMQKSLVDQQRMMTGGTIRAARMAMSSLYPRRIINIGGGFHHAYPDCGYAFCVFNDVAVAIKHLRKHGFDKTIMVIDLDLHQGDGTKKCFAHDQSVVTYSVHAENWDNEELENNYDIALGPAISDRVYLETIAQTLPKLIHRHQPEIVFYLAGTDVAEDDELGDWRISHDGIFERDCLIDQIVGKRRMVVLTAGGYGKNAWRHSARFFGYLTAGLSKPIASYNERLITSLKRMSRSLAVHNLTLENDDTDDDLLGDFFFHARKSSKLFDYYSVYGVECMLDKMGVMAHVNNLGFPMPMLEMDTEHPNGQAIRLYGDSTKTLLLIEAVLGEIKSLGQLRVLWIEWLLLQNPTLSVSEERPLLPGQTHPGLGCLPKIIGMLIIICERLKFDAIGFNPSHYHVCFLAKGQGFFEEPKAEARFRVAQLLTAGSNIQEASQELHEGLEFGKQVFKWEPARMLIPISAAAKAYFHSEDYQREVAKLATLELKRLRATRVGHALHDPRSKRTR